MRTVRFWNALRTGGILVFYGAVYLALGPADTPASNSLSERVLGKARNDLFNYVQWEGDAIGQKVAQQAGQQFIGATTFFKDAQAACYVYDYLALLRKLQATQAQIDAMYADKTIVDPDA